MGNEYAITRAHTYTRTSVTCVRCAAGAINVDLNLQENIFSDDEAEPEAIAVSASSTQCTPQQMATPSANAYKDAKDPFDEFMSSASSSAPGVAPTLHQDTTTTTTRTERDPFADVQPASPANKDPAVMPIQRKKSGGVRALPGETFTKISGTKAADVPVLVIPTKGGGMDGGGWRQGAQVYIYPLKLGCVLIVGL